jgi:hypothetical protein
MEKELVAETLPEELLAALLLTDTQELAVEEGEVTQLRV